MWGSNGRLPAANREDTKYFSTFIYHLRPVPARLGAMLSVVEGGLHLCNAKDEGGDRWFGVRSAAADGRGRRCVEAHGVISVDAAAAIGGSRNPYAHL